MSASPDKKYTLFGDGIRSTYVKQEYFPVIPGKARDVLIMDQLLKNKPWRVLRKTGRWLPHPGKARAENTTHFSRIIGQVNEDISTIGHLVKDHGKIFDTVRFQQNPFESVLSEIGHDTILGIP
jgi:hypothetical protein